MHRIQLLLLAFLPLFLFSCVPAADVIAPNSKPLPDFILGTWYGILAVEDIHEEYDQEFFVEFVDKDSLTFQMISPYSGFEDTFFYQFTDEKTLLVENERAGGGTWQVTRMGHQLQISIWSENSCVLFTRVE
ncbi:MAG: hypothetical protein JXA25_02195 [Anaerolineales bacterium]|nr:hypothetical protein [Anaerolineales bacterium]